MVEYFSALARGFLYEPEHLCSLNLSSSDRHLWPVPKWRSFGIKQPPETRPAQLFVADARSRVTGLHGPALREWLSLGLLNLGARLQLKRVLAKSCDSFERLRHSGNTETHLEHRRLWRKRLRGEIGND